jgi:hypothetical protein
MKLQFDDMKVTFNPKYMDGRYFLQNNSGITEMFIYVDLRVAEEGPLIVSFVYV